jgi:lambda family phage tail tape measure protein
MADIKYSIDTDVSGSVNPLQQLQTQLGKTQGAFSSLKSAIGTLGVSALVASAYQLADSLNDISDASGMALKNVMGFSQAIAASGGSVDGALNGIGRFNQTLSSAAEGSKQSQNAFLELGITFQELRTLSEQDLLARTVQGLANTTDNAKRTAIAVDIFGKSFAGVDFAKVNGNLDDFIKKSGVSADAVKAAGDASDNFASAFKTLQIQILASLQPISELVNNIAKASEAINTFIKIAVQIASVAATFFILTKVVSVATAAFLAIRAGIASAGGVMTVVSNAFNNFAAILGQLNSIGGPLRGTFVVLRNYIGDLGKWALNSIPGLASLGLALSYLGDYASGAYAKLKDLLGIGEKPTFLDQAEVDRENKLLAQRAAELKKNQEDTRKIKTESEKLSVELNKVLKAYQDTNKEANLKYKLETDALNQSDKAKALAQERFSAEKSFNQELQKLQDQINEKRNAGTPVDLAVIPQLEAAQGRLRAEYNKQKASIDALVESRINAERAKQLDIFSTAQLIDLQNKANDLIERSATMFLPLQAKGYAELEIAARNAAKAKIEAEQERRGEKLSPEEATKYYEAARQGIDNVKAAQDQLNVSTEKYNLVQYGLKNQYDMYDKIRDVQLEMATTGMTALEKKHYDVAAAARKSADAQIRAEELRTGRFFDFDERQAYYDEAQKGVKELQDAETDAYNKSRDGILSLRKSIAEYVDDTTNAAKIVETTFKKATQGMEDALVKFAKTGKFEWKSMVSSMLEDLLRSQLRQTMASVFQIGGNQVKGGGGGLLGGSIIPGILAAGGPVSDRRPYLVGERGPELFVPNSAGSMVPNSGLQGGGNVTYNISAVDALSFKQMIAKDPGFIHAIATQGSKYTPARR